MILKTVLQGKGTFLKRYGWFVGKKKKKYDIFSD